MTQIVFESSSRRRGIPCYCIRESHDPFQYIAYASEVLTMHIDQQIVRSRIVLQEAFRMRGGREILH